MEKAKIAIIVVVTLLVILLVVEGFSLLIIDYSNKENIDIIVIEKYIKNDTYYVATENEVFIIKDLPFKDIYDSADTYNKIEVGGKYKVVVTGKRNHVFSKFRIINNIQLEV